MTELAPEQYAGTVAQWRQALATATRARALDDPHLGDAWVGLAELEPPETLFAEPGRPCRSFSQWWNRVARRAAG
jgi:hypothetical protein